MPSRRGSFGSSLNPFGTGTLSDLSVYDITPTPQQQPIYQQQPVQDWYTPAPPPVAPTVAPEQGVLPEPVIPRPTLPWIYLNPDTTEAREAIRARAIAAGKTPTTAEINATYAANKARLLAELGVAQPTAYEPAQPTYEPAQPTYEPPPPAPTRPTLPWLYANPDTTEAREAIRARAIAAGHNPTTAEINATYAANKARLLAEIEAWTP